MSKKGENESNDVKQEKHMTYEMCKLKCDTLNKEIIHINERLDDKNEEINKQCTNIQNAIEEIKKNQKEIPY